MYKMVDIIDIFNTLNISIETVLKTQEMLKFVTDRLKTKKMFKHTVKNYHIY